MWINLLFVVQNWVSFYRCELTYFLSSKIELVFVVQYLVLTYFFVVQNWVRAQSPQCQCGVWQNICLIPNENILNKKHSEWPWYTWPVRRVRMYVYEACTYVCILLLRSLSSSAFDLLSVRENFFWKSPAHTILTFSKIPRRPLIEPNVVSVYPIKSKLTIIRVCEVQRGQFGWCDIIDWPMSTFNTQWKESWINFQNGVESFFTWPFEIVVKCFLLGLPSGLWAAYEGNSGQLMLFRESRPISAQWDIYRIFTPQQNVTRGDIFSQYFLWENICMGYL